MEDVVSYKCPSCGASLIFGTETQDFGCEYCGGHFNKEQLDEIYGSSQEAYPGLEPDAESEELNRQTEKFAEENRLYMCPSCGAAIVTDSDLSASAECHYCHSPVVLSGRLSGEFRPDKIIPFTRTKQDAMDGFNNWLRPKKMFAAKGFGSPQTLQKIQGLYVPYWLADCCVEGNITANCYKTISAVRTGDYITTTESHHIAVRKGSIIYHGVPADGSSKADDALMESIEPFDYNQMIDFNMAYLSGHYSEKYDVTKEMVHDRIMRRVCADTTAQLMKTITGYSRISVKESQTVLTNINWKYVMLPIWFLSYTYKGKMYYYAMNGQTGKFGGIVPLDKLKLFLFSAGIGLAVLAVIIALGFFGGIV